MEVIFKEGMLHLQGAKFGKRTWRKIWMVLFKPSSMGVGRLEFRSVSDSEQLKACRQKAQERKVVRLSDCLSVTPAAKESCPARCTAFYLNTTHHTYTFASTESQDWISALCILAFQRDPGESDKGDFEGGNGLTMEDNDLYSSWKSEPTLPPDQYKVKVLGTDAAKRCKLAGEYVVFTDSEALELLDVNTGGVIYSWPYRLLRKFGQVEGGFCIEAGRRCDSGEGVFTFLTREGPQIYQALSSQCSLQKKQGARPCGVKKRSSFDVSSVTLPAAVVQTDAAPIYSLVQVRRDKEDSSASQYATINRPSEESMRHLCLVQPYLSSSKEEVGEESKEEEEEEEEQEEEEVVEEEEEAEGEDDQCHSLEPVDEDGDTKDSIYYNLRKTTPPPMRRTQIGEFQCTYRETKRYSFPSSGLHYSNEPLSLDLTNADHFASALPQSLPPPPADIYDCAGYNAQAADDTGDPEEAAGFAVPSETPGSFKQRLAEIISKDLAKFQPPLPY
ncbi:docking protein 3 [Poecilia formosa]|uniref:Docking protein 3 n=1 Tax=Poecilia formosa TaxID=48698 RepID=A0A096M6L3_POEFO|nr:PREDICTED: docking protein 3 [Poecilia formosa]